MQPPTVGSVFDLLTKPVQTALYEFGFTEPTLPQTKAFPPILAGRKRAFDCADRHRQNRSRPAADFLKAG